MLDMFIKQGVDVSSLILPSRAKIQKLIDTLRWRSSGVEIRELAAKILGCLAWDIDLTQYPGAIRCISSLLDTTLPYWNYQQGLNQSQLKLEESTGGALINRVKRLEQRRAKRRNQEGENQQGEVNRSINDSKEDSWNKLILQGLIILERLGSDQHNCRDICSTPNLLDKIMAPIYSDTLIQDINFSAWADVVNGSFRVVHQLIRSSEWNSRTLPHEILCSEQAMSNLEKILDQGKQAGQELQMRAIEILTELALDFSINLTRGTKENLINKQLQIFLADNEGEEENLKVTAGETLALLSKTGTISVFIMSKYGYVVDCLTEILDAKNKIIYRTIAAEILENLCTHHTMDKEYVKNTLLPKILTEVLTSKREPRPSQRKSYWYHRITLPNYEIGLTNNRKPHTTEASQRNISEPGDHAENQDIHGVSSEGNDEEKQLWEHKGQIKSLDQANEEQIAVMELQEAFLSLTLVICNKMISADDFDVVTPTIAPGVGEFVAKLKAIVEDNCEATANCLRIVKLCGQIAVLMMQHSQYIVHFKDQKFVETLSNASRSMSNLESCMLFAGTDCGAKKTVRPLLSDLVKEAQALVA